MICLHCGELLNTPEERALKWHNRCIRKFFGTTVLPELQLSKRNLEKLIDANINKGHTVPGVQKKLSLHLSQGRPSRLTMVGYPAGYIMKPQAEEYQNLPEYEFLAMLMAKAVGIKTVPFALYYTGGKYVYLTKRIDRSDDGRMAMEDFCQLQGRLVEDKYRGSYEGCARIIGKYSRSRDLDLAEMFSRIVLSFLVGNSDLHLQNFSLVESTPGARDFRLSAAYDILPVNVVEPRDEDEMALSLNGKNRHLERSDFMGFAHYCGITEKTANRLIEYICNKKSLLEKMIDNSLLKESQKEAISTLLNERYLKLHQ